jgi:HK97 family phage major capsid protein
VTKLIKRSLPVDNQIDTRSDDENNNFVTLSFSSEVACQRTDEHGRKYYEVLDHSIDSVDLSRLKQRAPVLDGHDWNKQIGVIESVSIGSDKKGRAVVKMSRSQEGQEFYQDIVDGIRGNVSVGYTLGNYRSVGRVDGIEVRRYEWFPHEISFVAVPADTSVGVARSLEEHPTAAEIEEAERVAEIKTLGEKWKVPTAEAIQRGYSIDEFKKLAMNYLENKSDSIPTGRNHQEIKVTKGNTYMHTTFKDASRSVRQASDFPITAAIAAQLRQSAPSQMEGLFIDEKSADDLKEHGQRQAEQLRGDDVISRGVMIGSDFRSLNTTTNSDDIVPTDLREDLFIEYLRSESPILSRVRLNLTGLRGDCVIPRQTNTGDASWVAEDGEATDSELTFDSIKLTPHTLTAAIPFTRRLMLQSAPNIELICRMDLMAKNVEEMERVLLKGDSATNANEPNGIWKTADTAKVDIVDLAKPTYKEMAKFISTAKKAKALKTKNQTTYGDEGNSAPFVWVMNPEMEAYFTTTLTDDNSHKYMMEDSKILGIPVIVSDHLADTEYGLIDPTQIIVGTWSAIDLVVDKATKVKSNGTVVRTFADLDYGFRHPKSFVLAQKKAA